MAIDLVVAWQSGLIVGWQLNLSLDGNACRWMAIDLVVAWQFGLSLDGNPPGP